MQLSSLRLPVASQRAVFGFVLVVLVGASLPYAGKAQANASAFVRWHNQITGLLAGEDIYQRHGYPNPPMMALLLYPLTLLPPTAGALCWYGIKVAMALAALAWTFRLVEGAGKPLPVWGQFLVALLCLRPFLGDLSHGNVNLFILFLVVACLGALEQGYGAGAGLVLALAIACKVTPALFVPYFLWKRAWTVLAGCAIGLVLFFLIIPSLCIGWSRNAALLDSWTARMVEPYLLTGRVLYTEHNNQSLPAVVLRLTTDCPSFSTYVDGQHTPVRYDNIVAWPPAVARWLIGGCLLAFAGLICWTCRTPLPSVGPATRAALGPRSARGAHGGAARESWRPAAEFALVLLGMLLFSERTWKHHCVLRAVPLAVIIYFIARCGPNRLLAMTVIGTLVLAELLSATTSTGLLPGDAAKMAQVYGTCAWANVLFVVALAVMLRSTVPAR